MDNKAFDRYSDKYDQWFLQNENILASEVLLLAHFLKNPGRAFSVGCGSGLFEAILKKDHGIEINEGLEPSEGMADIARKRGMEVLIGTAEETSFGKSEYDTVIFNGSPGYISDFSQALSHACDALKPAGQIVVIDIPKESSYALLYNLAMVLDTWDHVLLNGVKPKSVYPIEFVKDANWRTTAEKVDLMSGAGLNDFEFAQTLTGHPVFSDDGVEKPVKGYDKGDYVAIRGIKP